MELMRKVSYLYSIGVPGTFEASRRPNVDSGIGFTVDMPVNSFSELH